MFYPTVWTLLDYESLVWYRKHRVERTISSTMAVFRFDSRPEWMTDIEQEISRTAARADLKRLGWRPIQQLLTYDIVDYPTFEIEIPRTVREMEIEDPCAFL